MNLELRGLTVNELAVVLISRNQEWNIARLIESVLEETAHIRSKEILLVDSASLDSTIDAAKRYPITVLMLHPDQPLTPAAGRYVGYKYSSGELVLFLDGDMELCRGWLDRALRVLERKPEFAVLTGIRIDLPKSSPRNYKEHPPQKEGSDRITEVPHGGGAAIYRRSVLEQVGSFNPYLHSDEEPELCLRIRKAGYQVIRLGYPIVFHYSEPLERISTLLSRRKRGFWLGMGQNLRIHLGGRLFWPYLRERGYGCLPGLLLALGVSSLALSLITAEWTWFGLWAFGLFVAIGGMMLRNQSIYRTLYSIVQRTMIIEGTLRGFLLKPVPADTFAPKVDIVRQSERNREEFARTPSQLRRRAAE